MARTIALTTRPLWRRRVEGAIPLDLSRGQTLDWLCVIGFSVGALALALTHPWTHAYIGEAQYGDAAYWDFAGENWARGYFTAKAPDIRPGYSVFLGIVYVLTGATFQYAFVAQALLFAVSVGLVYAIGRMIRGRLAGALAAALLALDPYLWEWVATSTTELLGSFANLVAVFFLVRGCRPRARALDLAWFGLWLAIANVVRPVTLPFVLLALGLVLLVQQWPWRRRLLGAVVAGAAVAVGLLPGVLYQYYMTGDSTLSSNSAANLFAASSPQYATWTPAIYDDVSKQLTDRGVVVTQESLNAEFTHLTIQNYVQYPGFQLQRVVDGFRAYGEFEGQATRPERFTVFRPWLLAAASAALVALILARRRYAWWLGVPGLVLVAGLVSHPARMLVVLQVASLLLPVLALRRDPRALGWLLVALFWFTTGLLAILTTGIAGFFLNRLYTQVEPERALLLALAIVELTVLALPVRRRAPILQFVTLARAWRLRMPFRARLTPSWLAACALIVTAVGLIRLADVNLQPAETRALAHPTGEQLTALVARIGLPGPVVYVDEALFGPTRELLMSGQPPRTHTIYAIPGQYTRFLWHLEDQDRTLFWYVYADQTRPLALDRNLITGESVGRLLVANFANRPGLLFVAPTTSYFDRTGVVALQNVLNVRAFAPWDDRAGRFLLEDAHVFPLSWPLYDEAHVATASREGQVSDLGPLRLTPTGRMLRSLGFRPAGLAQTATLIYRDVWVPPATEFRAGYALHPRFAGHNQIGRPRLEVSLQTGTETVMLLEHTFDSARKADFDFAPLHADLAPFSDQRVDIIVRVLADPSATQTPEVLLGEPQLLTP